MGLTFTAENINGTEVIHLSGRLIEKTQADGMIAHFNQLLSSGQTRFVIGLTDLEYVNSTGLNLLIGMFTKARNAGGELVIGGISPKVSKLMVITKLDSIFKIHGSIEEALEDINS